MNKKCLDLYLVSDSTGETVKSVANSTLVQFKNIEITEHVYSLIKTKEQIYDLVQKIKPNTSLVMYTIMNNDLSKLLVDECSKIGVTTIAVLSRVTNQLSKFLGQSAIYETGIQHELDKEYFDRVEAINFALTHDDGQSLWDISQAHIIIIGVSRTSKSPTSLYLAFKGIMTANIPFISSDTFPIAVDKLKKNSFVIALTIHPERLTQIRKNRLLSINNIDNFKYIDYNHIQAEITDMRKFLLPHGCEVIDVTRKSVEETAAEIIQKYNNWKNGRFLC